MKGVLLHSGDDVVIEKRSKAFGLKLAKVAFPPQELPFEKNLIVQAGTRVPWDLLPAAWNFLERWDAAVPLWRYGVVAADVGTPEERHRTQAIVRDLRVLLHSYELLFVRRNEAGCLLVGRWCQECEGGCDRRLAFLRAFYVIKPTLCVLPTTWLADVQGHSKKVAAQARAGRVRPSGGTLIRLELEPGRVVKVAPKDVDAVLARHKQQKARR